MFCPPPWTEGGEDPSFPSHWDPPPHRPIEAAEPLALECTVTSAEADPDAVTARHSALFLPPFRCVFFALGFLSTGNL